MRMFRLLAVPVSRMHLRDVLLSRSQNTLGPDSTVGRIVDHYNYDRPPLAPLDVSDESTDSQVTVPNLSQPPALDLARVHARGGGDSMFHFFAHPENGRHRFTFNVPRQLPVPPNTPAPASPALGASNRMPEEVSSGFTDLLTTDQTYGDTGQLLRLTPQEVRNEGRPVPSSSMRSAFGYYGLATEPSQSDYGDQPSPAEAVWGDDDGEDKENTPPSNVRPGAAFTTNYRAENSQPRYGSDLPFRRSAYRNNAASNDMLRSSSYYPEDDASWETQASESRTHLAGDSTRPSQESYADTSVYGSTPRLSGQRSNAADVFGPMPSAKASATRAVRRPQNPTPSRFPTDWTAAAEDAERRTHRILEARIAEQEALANNPGATLGGNGAQRREDEVFLETTRQRNPGLIQRVIGAVLGARPMVSPPRQVYHRGDSFSEVAGNALGSIPAAHLSSSETQGLLQDDGSPFVSRALRYSDSADTFQTTPRPTSSAYGRSGQPRIHWSSTAPIRSPGTRIRPRWPKQDSDAH